MIQDLILCLMKEAKAMAVTLKKKRYFCQADAEQAANELMAQTTRYHRLAIEIVECPRYGKGRPKQGVPRTAIAMEYEPRILVSVHLPRPPRGRGPG